MTTIRVVDRRYEKVEGGGHEWVSYDKLVTYPEGSKVSWNVNQHTLLIQTPAGETIAALTGLSAAIRDDLVTVEVRNG